MSKVYLAPSKVFAEAHGIPEIWCDWGLSNHADLEDRMGRPWTDDLDRSLALWIVGHAPQFLLLCVDDMALYDVAKGMTSQFVEDDIRYFVQYRSFETRPESLQKRYERLREVGLDVQWVPSRPTLDIIETKIGVYA